MLLPHLQVSILQIACEKRVYIIDLIKLFKDVPDILDSCLARILHSPRILKLGMANLNIVIMQSHPFITIGVLDCKHGINEFNLGKCFLEKVFRGKGN